MLPSLKLLFGIEEIAMASMKRSAMVASMLLLFAIIASACDMPYSTPPSVTSTPINSNSLFQTPLGQATNMNDVQNLATASAMAQAAAAHAQAPQAPVLQEQSSAA